MRITLNSNDPRWPIAAHIVPFILWVGIMSLPMKDVALRYALQASVSLVAFLLFRPWQYYQRLNLQALPLSLFVGVAVAVVWILPESAWIRQFPGIYESYARFFIRGTGLGNGAAFAPENCGWLLSLVRISGSAFVIAVIEEYFWRGFLMRWLTKPDFISVDPLAVRWGIFWVTAIAFGLEHDRWLVGVLAGLAYGWLYLRRGDITAVAVAHVITNYVLGLYVLATHSYQFW